MSQLQAVLFPIDKFTAKQSRDWLKEYKIKPIKKAHNTDNYRRYRVTEPDDKKKFKTLNVPGNRGIKVIVMLK